MTWDRLSPLRAMASTAATTSLSSVTDVFSFASRSYPLLRCAARVLHPGAWCQVVAAAMR